MDKRAKEVLTGIAGISAAITGGAILINNTPDIYTALQKKTEIDIPINIKQLKQKLESAKPATESKDIEYMVLKGYAETPKYSLPGFSVYLIGSALLMLGGKYIIDKCWKLIKGPNKQNRH